MSTLQNDKFLKNYAIIRLVSKFITCNGLLPIGCHTATTWAPVMNLFELFRTLNIENLKKVLFYVIMYMSRKLA